MAARTESFGIFVSCHKGDYRLARGCVASLRFFAPRVPLCLLVDGGFSTADIERLPGVQVIRRADVSDPWLRANSFGGFGYSKLVPFWEGPFDHFLYLDADCVVLGDIVGRVTVPGGDVVAPDGGRVITDEAIIGEHWYDCSLLRSNFPEFDPVGWPFFCTGTFVGRQGILDLDIYRRLLQLQVQNRKSFMPESRES